MKKEWKKYKTSEHEGITSQHECKTSYRQYEWKRMKTSEHGCITSDEYKASGFEHQLKTSDRELSRV